MKMSIVVKGLLSGFLKKRMTFLLKRKINKILRNVKTYPDLYKPSLEEIRKHRNLWEVFDKNINYSWLRVYETVSGIRSINYVPENIYYTEIEPRLNNKAFSKAYTDKNFYHAFLDHDVLPEVVVHSVSGVKYDRNYANLGRNLTVEAFGRILGNGKFVIKPTIDTGGGSGVRVFEISGDRFKLRPEITGVDSVTDLIKYYNRDFVIQKYIEQHHFFSRFNPDSLNTIRILTYRSLLNEKVVILQRILRMGKAGSVVDNQASGGIACGVSPAGVLSVFGIDKYGKKHYDSNGVIFNSVGTLPFIDIVCDTAMGIAQKFPYSRLLGMDFGIDINGKVFLIEVNDSNNEINFYQMNNGPLFGEYTEEITHLCLKEPKSVVIDYNLI